MYIWGRLFCLLKEIFFQEKKQSKNGIAENRMACYTELTERKVAGGVENKEMLWHILQYIDENIRGEQSVSILARETGYSPFHFSRIFTKTAGMRLYKSIQKMLRLSAVLLFPSYRHNAAL